jgi:hypothetical protein
MKINVDGLTNCCPGDEPRVGNVYAVKGGNGMKEGAMMVLIAITDNSAGLMLVITKAGKPKGITQYGIGYLEERCPIAFVDGLDDLELTMRSI